MDIATCQTVRVIVVAMVDIVRCPNVSDCFKKLYLFEMTLDTLQLSFMYQFVFHTIKGEKDCHCSFGLCTMPICEEDCGCLVSWDESKGFGHCDMPCCKGDCRCPEGSCNKSASVSRGLLSYDDTGEMICTASSNSSMIGLSVGLSILAFGIVSIYFKTKKMGPKDPVIVPFKTRRDIS